MKISKRLSLILVLILLVTAVPAFAENDGVTNTVDDGADTAPTAAPEEEVSEADLQAADGETFDASSYTGEAVRINKYCQFKVSSGSWKYLTDNKPKTAWAAKSGTSVAKVMLPETGAGYLRVRWYIEPTDYTVTMYDADLNELASYTAATDACPVREMVYTISDGARYIGVSFDQDGQAISELDIYSVGTLPDTVITWTKPENEKCDLMIVSAHQDDEWLWFGGMIPYYSRVRGKTVQIVYMANCGRDRYSEALNSIAKAGLNTYPCFVGLKDKRLKYFDDAVKLWGGKKKIMKYMVALIRRYKPSVIVTHDINGEYGHNQHKICAAVMVEAIKAAADPTQYTESYDLYGAWQVQKCYLHLSEQNPIQMDWDTPYDELDGKTPLQVATEAMNEQVSQLEWFQVEDHGEYDNSKFGLVYSTVGSDALGADIFENVTDDSQAAQAAQTEEADEDAADDPLGGMSFASLMEEDD